MAKVVVAPTNKKLGPPKPPAKPKGIVIHSPTDLQRMHSNMKRRALNSEAMIIALYLRARQGLNKKRKSWPET